MNNVGIPSSRGNKTHSNSSIAIKGRVLFTVTLLNFLFSTFSV